MPKTVEDAIREIESWIIQGRDERDSPILSADEYLDLLKRFVEVESACETLGRVGL